LKNEEDIAQQKYLVMVELTEILNEMNECIAVNDQFVFSTNENKNNADKTMENAGDDLILEDSKSGSKKDEIKDVKNSNGDDDESEVVVGVESDQKEKGDDDKSEKQTDKENSKKTNESTDVGKEDASEYEENKELDIEASQDGKDIKKLAGQLSKDSANSNSEKKKEELSQPDDRGIGDKRKITNGNQDEKEDLKISKEKSENVKTKVLEINSRLQEWSERIESIIERCATLQPSLSSWLKKACEII